MNQKISDQRKESSGRSPPNIRWIRANQHSTCQRCDQSDAEDDVQCIPRDAMLQMQLREKARSGSIASHAIKHPACANGGRDGQTKRGGNRCQRNPERTATPMARRHLGDRHLPAFSYLLKMADLAAVGQGPNSEDNKSSVEEERKNGGLRDQTVRHLGFFGQGADHVEAAVSQNGKNHGAENGARSAGRGLQRKTFDAKGVAARTGRKPNDGDAKSELDRAFKKQKKQCAFG